jgi:CRP/FNR family transcriptional regulator
MATKKERQAGKETRSTTNDPFCAGTDGPPFRFAQQDVGSVLLRHGAPVRAICCVRSGRVKLSVADASGTERAYAMRGPGSLLGLEALLGLPSLFDARVDVAGEVGFVAPAQLERWIESNPDHAPSVVKRVLAEEVKLASERQLIDGTAEARLARFLLDRENNRFLSAWNHTLRRDVAVLLGMRPETLSRTIRTFRRRGVVDAELKVVDVRALRRLAGENNHVS